MAKSNDFRFRINTAWRRDTERAVIFSDVQAYFGTQFTDKCLNVLHLDLKPLSLALRGKSRSEVLLAITEAKAKSDIYYDLALSIVTIGSSDDEPVHSAPEVPANSAVQVPTEKTVYSQQVENLFDEEEDD